MKVKLLEPYGYCFGVNNAINKVLKIREQNPDEPIYIYGMLVHNNHVSELLEKNNIITLSRDVDLNALEKAIVISTAHGISNADIMKITNAGHTFIDATCPIVYKAFKSIKNELDSNLEIFYLGKENHPEAKASLSISPSKIHLIEKKEDVLNYSKEIKYGLTGQTTMTEFELDEIYDFLVKNHYDVIRMDDVCKATTIRQTNLRNEAKNYDAIFVVGDKKSNNNTQLYLIAKELNSNSFFISSKDEIDDNNLNFNSCLVTSGTSTPSEVVDEVVDYLSKK